MAYACIQEIKKAAERAMQSISDKEAEELLDRIEYARKRRGEGKNLTDSEMDSLYAEARAIAREAKISAAINKRNRLINAKIYGNIMRKIEENPERASKILVDELVGSLDYVKEGRLSVDSEGGAIASDYTGLLVAKLEEADLLQTFNSGSLDSEIYLYRYDKAAKVSEEAKKISDIMEDVQKAMLRRKNAAGANIRELMNYVVKQAHDSNLMRRAGFQKWRDDILPLLNQERTFANLLPGQDREKFLRDIYESLVSGNHQRVDSSRGLDGQPDPLADVFTGQPSLAKKLSENRVLHFADGAKAYEYASNYSRMSLAEALHAGVMSDSRSIALMERFGTNPKMMIERIIRDARARNKVKPEFTENFNERMIQISLAEVDGTTVAKGAGRPIVLGADLATIASATRMVQAMAKLGMSVISSFADVATKAAFIQTSTGRSMFTSYARALGDVFNMFNPAEQKEFAVRLKILSDAMIGDVLTRHGSSDMQPGFVTKAVKRFFKLNGMNYWNSSQKTGVARVLAYDLARHANMRFEDIPIESQKTYEQYGIGKQEISILRSVLDEAADGETYVFPDSINRLSNDLIDPLISAERGELAITDVMREQYKNNLRTRYIAFLNDSADMAIPTPGARERAYLTQGTRRGTPTGEAIRFAAQFKSFPVTYMTKGLMRQYYGRRAAGKSGLLGVTQLALGSTVMGYIAMSAKDILKGKEPMDVFNDKYILDPKTFSAAFAQGGGAGLLGDLLFQDYNRYGQSLEASLAGPTVGAVGDFLKIWPRLFSDKPEKGVQQALRFAVNNTPFANLFYTKFAVDYLFLYGMNEAISPGYIDRLERRTKRDKGQEFYLPPSDYAIQF